MKLKIYQRIVPGYREYKGIIDFKGKKVDIEDFKKFMKNKLPCVEHEEVEERK